ncbi:MAG: hypothetical protein FJX22_02120 [Alphaproteobacteria bacterium]|nr:hypothetical protein [Alphaproteobacteria bacterium]
MEPKLFINLIFGKIFLIIVLFNGFGWVESLAKTPAIHNIAGMYNGQGMYAAAGANGDPQKQALMSLAAQMQANGMGDLLNADPQSLQQIAGQLASAM